MDEKTAELRDLFVETTGEETVTESQSRPRGSIGTERDEATVDERLDDLIETMRDRYEFESSLSTADLRQVVRAFFDPDVAGAGTDSWSAAADKVLASSLSADIDAAAVFQARMELHLVSDADREGPVPYAQLRRRVLAITDDEPRADRPAVDDTALAASLSAAMDEPIDAAAIARPRRAVEADLASRRVNHRFRDAFTDLLTDADLSTRLAEDARRDGLREATEDIETDVSF